MIKVKSPKFLYFFTRDRAVIAMSVFCFLIYRDILKPEDINHEEIHWMQCKECLFIGFWILYFYFQIVNGYDNNPFEIEAYKNENNLSYLQQRKLYAWAK
jgi:hypothetical protein